MTYTIGTHFKVGDRAIYEDGVGWGVRGLCVRAKVVTINGINTDVPAGEEPDISIKMGPSGPVRDTVLRKLHPYKTPKYPPGVIPSKFYLDCPIEEIEEVEDYILKMGETKDETNTLKEMNENDIASILAGEGRDISLLGIDPKDMDDFEDKCNMREEYHRLIAKTPQGGRDDSSVADNMEMGNRLHERNIVLRNRKKTSTEGVEELDSKDRIMVEATMKNKGENYMSATTKYGALYIDMKFTKYVPEIGEKFKCVMGIRGPTGNLPWKCYRIV